MFLASISTHFTNAEEMIAVPCVIVEHRNIQHLLSILLQCKTFRALMSSIDPPNVGRSPPILIISSGSCEFNSDIKNINIRKFLNSTPLPSITGLLANAPRSPRPKIAVLEITATKFPWMYVSILRIFDLKTGPARPEYAKLKSFAYPSAWSAQCNFAGFPLSR